MHRLRFLFTVLFTSTSLLFLIGVVSAGPLSPAANPAATSYTLSDIYTRLTTNAPATAGNHAFAPSGAPAASLYSLTELYNTIPTIDAAKVASGTTYLGVKGTLLGNMWNGTSGAFTGGSQANGGADDYNNALGPPADRYAGTWTPCTAGNDYCGTDDPGADAKDESTGLLWSLPCNEVGCTSFSDSAPLTYTWNNSGINNNSRTASELCSDHPGWYLPNQKQLMQAYIDGAWDNLDTIGTLFIYWSSTTVSNLPTSAWRVEFFYGRTNYTAKTGTSNIRCVRPSP